MATGSPFFGWSLFGDTFVPIDDTFWPWGFWRALTRACGENSIYDTYDAYDTFLRLTHPPPPLLPMLGALFLSFYILYNL
jgi:hypothetical protein